MGILARSLLGNLTIWREILTFEIKKYIRNSGKSDYLAGKKYTFSGRGGVLEKILGRYVPPRFSKRRVSELIFWLETGISGTNFPYNLCHVSRAEI